MLKNSEMRKIQWLSKGQLSQGRGKILFFHVFPVPDLSNLPHREAQHDEILLQKLMEFSDSAFSRNFSHLLFVRYSTLSPPLPSPFPMAHPMLPSGCLHQISFPLPSRIADLISRAPLSPPPNTAANSFLFCPVHPSHLPFWCFASSALLWIWIPPFSCCLQFLRPLQKRVQTTRITWYCPLPRSCPLETCIPLSAGCIPFPTSHQDSHTGHVVSYVGWITVVYPPCSTALGSSLAAASFHLPFFQVPASLPPSAPGSLPPSPAIPLKTQTGSWRVISFFVYL